MAKNNGRLQWHEDTWHALFLDGLLGRFLGFHHLPALAQLSKSHLRLHHEHRVAMWGSCCAGASTKELVRVLPHNAKIGQAVLFKMTLHYLCERKELSGVQEILTTCLHDSANAGHLEVIKALVSARCPALAAS